jgi:two-component system C4-dicarboxylate transport sensor histidine kinase DctB
MTSDERILETGRLAELGLQASSLVHELRQPVFAIRALAQLLIAEIPEAGRPNLEALLEQVDTLATLIERYGASSRRPTGEIQPTDLSSAAIAGAEGPHTTRSGVQIIVHAEPGSSWVHADAIAIRQITGNLVRNAIDAARSQVVVTVNGHTLSVEDDGAGIPPEIEARLGEPFVTSKPPGEGTGLGLAVTQNLISAVDGSLKWQTGDTGTCFTVEFIPFQGSDNA